MGTAHVEQKRLQTKPKESSVSEQQEAYLARKERHRSLARERKRRQRARQRAEIAKAAA